MTENLINRIAIKNFGVIKLADIDIKDVNIIIGPQSSGKSLIAKLVYFFNTLNDVFVNYVYALEVEYNFADAMLERFSLLFPPYLWRDKSFNIKYKIDDVEITWSYRRKTANNDSKHKIVLSDALIAALSVVKKNAIESSVYREVKLSGKLMRVRQRYPKQDIETDLENIFPSYFRRSLFIPSGRTFLHTLKLNTFSLEKLQIDQFIREFGAEYASIKEYFINDNRLELDTHDERAFESILKGYYEYDDAEDEDWIVTIEGHRTKLAHASSGQQESLPMLATLAVVPILMTFDQSPGMIFIEEPEAHLYPTAQNEVVSFISSLHKQYDTKFFMTSHSPYIISALNNMIQANELIRKKLLTESKFNKLNKGGASIPFDVIAAYTIENGVVKSIMDDAYKMIGAYKLDDISNHFQEVQNKLSMLEI